MGKKANRRVNRQMTQEAAAEQQELEEAIASIQKLEEGDFMERADEILAQENEDDFHAASVEATGEEGIVLPAPSAAAAAPTPAARDQQPVHLAQQQEQAQQEQPPSHSHQNEYSFLDEMEAEYDQAPPATGAKDVLLSQAAEQQSGGEQQAAVAPLLANLQPLPQEQVEAMEAVEVKQMEKGACGDVAVDPRQLETAAGQPADPHTAPIATTPAATPPTPPAPTEAAASCEMPTQASPQSEQAASAATTAAPTPAVATAEPTVAPPAEAAARGEKRAATGSPQAPPKKRRHMDPSAPSSAGNRAPPKPKPKKEKKQKNGNSSTAKNNTNGITKKVTERDVIKHVSRLLRAFGKGDWDTVTRLIRPQQSADTKPRRPVQKPTTARKTETAAADRGTRPLPPPSPSTVPPPIPPLMKVKLPYPEPAPPYYEGPSRLSAPTGPQIFLGPNGQPLNATINDYIAAALNNSRPEYHQPDPCFWQPDLPNCNIYSTSSEESACPTIQKKRKRGGRWVKARKARYEAQRAACAAILAGDSGAPDEVRQAARQELDRQRQMMPPQPPALQ